jgi:uncharacterized protein YndB with AHSA1/START domain
MERAGSGETRRFTLRREIRAQVEDVFAAWVDPTVIAGWLAPRRGWRVVRSSIEISVRRGGPWRATLLDPARAPRELRFTIHDVSPPHKLMLVRSFGDGSVADALRISVLLAERSNSTDVTIHAEAAAEHVAEVALAWSSRLAGIAARFDGSARRKLRGGGTQEDGQARDRVYRSRVDTD